MHKTTLFQGLCLALAMTTTPAAAAETLSTGLPVATFSSLPSFDEPVLSPDGSHIAYAIQHGGHVNVIAQRLDGTGRIMFPPVKKGEISSFQWANDHTLLVQYGGSLKRHVFTHSAYETRQIAYDVKKASHPVWLGEPMRKGERVSQYERVIDLLPEEPDHILMELDFDLSGKPNVYRVNLTNGRRTLEHRRRAKIQDWYTDQNSEVRLGYGVANDGPHAVLLNSNGRWVDLDKLDWGKKFDVAGFADDPRFLYVSGQNKFGTLGLYKLDIESGKIVETLFEKEQADADGFIKHPGTGRLAGIVYTDDLTRIHYLDKDLELIQRSLNAVLKGTVNTIVGKARDKEIYLILAKSDRNPGDYYLYDRDHRKLGYVASRYHGVDPDLMATTRAVTIPVRDGSRIRGYLTLPKGRTDAHGLPAVILPHGGPIGVRDDAEWDYFAQFIASRGFAVLKPNYRGSGGYGSAFEDAGRNQWGGLMQDDVTDATKWLIKEGGIDAHRLCIVGASYGGYAALMGVIKEPGLYKCAASINGVTDLPEMKAYDKAYVGGHYWVKSMGLEGADDKRISPYDRVDDIGVPVLLVSAKDDTVVPNKQSRSLYKRLKHRNKPVRYEEIKAGEHWLTTTAARNTVLSALGEFLTQQIGDQ